MVMATSTEIKGFLARWLQLGKAVEPVGDGQPFKPHRVLSLHGYSQEFEQWWNEFEANSHQWSLSGSSQPLSELFRPEWEISSCARCDMPIPLLVAGLNGTDCPCSDLSTWPNLELPQPHTPRETENKLKQIHLKLKS